MPPRKTLLAATKTENSITTAENFTKLTASRLLEEVCSMGPIESHNTLDKLKSHISEYITLLPGSLTPQKYSNIDSDPEIDPMLHGKILEEIIEKFDHNWPLQGSVLDRGLVQLMVVDGATLSILTESLSVLTSALKETEDEKKMLAISMILEQLVKSDSLFSAIVDACKYQNRNRIEEEEFDETCRNTVQMLISLPNRVANKLKDKIFNTFVPQTYLKIISFHIARAFSFINIGLQHDIKAELKFMSLLISKLIIISKSDHLLPLTDILSEWCFQNKHNERNFIQDILKTLDTPSIEPIAVLFLKYCDVNLGVHQIFGDILPQPNWKYTLTTKIPLMCYYNDENLVINLISYLAQFLTENRILIELLLTLLDVWGDKSALNHTSVEQHKYITKLIIVCLRKSRNYLNREEKDNIQRLLVSGISAHLESTHIILKAIGMSVGEIFTSELSESDDAPKLSFEYKNMPNEVTDLVGTLTKLAIQTKDIKAKEPTEIIVPIVEDEEFMTLGDKKLYELGIECCLVPKSVRVADDIKNEQTLTVETSIESTMMSNKRISQNNVTSEKNVECDSELDSDDDLVPYDMSIDTKASEKLRPAYLRDLRDNLVNENSSTNPDIFSESLEISEDLILSQLPGDDVSFAIELLELFVTLKKYSYVENFEVLTFKSCVAIVTVFPKECAEFLCKQFYMEVDKYSVSQRLFFLDILAESARRLSAIPVHKDSAINEPIVKPRRREIQNKVSLFINTERSQQYSVLYSDDLDEFGKVEGQMQDWREIVDKRIESNTKRFAHSTKSSKIFENKFGNVASSFFYPLLYGFGKQGTCLNSGLHLFSDQENILLIRFLKALSTIMVAAKNCLLASKMGKEVLELSWVLRYHDQAKVRMAVMENVAAVLIAVPKDTIVNELFDMVIEIRLWLLDLTQNVISGDHDKECRSLGATVVSLIDSLIG